MHAARSFGHNSDYEKKIMPRHVGVKMGVSRSYRKSIRLWRMEDNGHYHYFSMSYAIVRYLPLTSGEA